MPRVYLNNNEWLLFLQEYRDQNNHLYVHRPKDLVRAAAAEWRQKSAAEKTSYKLKLLRIIFQQQGPN